VALPRFLLPPVVPKFFAAFQTTATVPALAPLPATTTTTTTTTDRELANGIDFDFNAFQPFLLPPSLPSHLSNVSIVSSLCATSQTQLPTKPNATCVQTTTFKRNVKTQKLRYCTYQCQPQLLSKRERNPPTNRNFHFQASKHASKQANQTLLPNFLPSKQTNRGSGNQSIKHSNKRTNERTDERTDEPTDDRTNQRTNEQTNSPLTCLLHSNCSKFISFVHSFTAG